MGQQTYEEKLKLALKDIKQEVTNAKKVYPDSFVNQHEAYAVILEEVDELWAEIKRNQKPMTSMHKERRLNKPLQCWLD